MSNIRANYTRGPMATVEAEGEGCMTATRKEERTCRLKRKKGSKLHRSSWISREERQEKEISVVLI